MPLFRLILLALVSSAGLNFGSIEYLEQRFYPEESFTRISEYFNGIEDPGNRFILRSEPDFRTGHYVTFELSTPYTVDHFRLEVYEYGSREPSEYLFKAETTIPAAKPIFLGLTGEKWNDQRQPPVAYKLSLVDKNGETLASATSFLWGDD